MRGTIDGALLARMIIHAAASINSQKQQINELNVFPVPDGDTGTNMGMTIATAAAELKKKATGNVGAVAQVNANALLRGARGNSGVILSLLFRGFAKALKDKDSADGADFAIALDYGVATAYKAVMKPAEGTILTVSRLCARRAAEAAREDRSVEFVLDEAIKACDDLLAGDITAELAACLRVERHRMGRLAQQFCVTREAALAAIRTEWPEFTEEQLDDLVARKRIDWRFIDGEQRFLDNFLDSLRVYPQEVPGLKKEESRDIEARDAMLERMHEKGGLTCEINLKAAIDIPGATPGEMLRAWLPVPAACPQQSDIDVYDWTPGVLVAKEDAPARTAFWGSRENHSFEASYRYRIHAPYVDTLAPAPAEHVVADDTVTEDDLSQLAPHIMFTPYLIALTERVVGEVERPIDQARAIYDYITVNVDYRYQPSYAQLDTTVYMMFLDAWRI